MAIFQTPPQSRDSRFRCPHEHNFHGQLTTDITDWIRINQDLLIRSIRGRSCLGSLCRRSNSLRSNLRLQEQQQVIASTCLRVSAGHVEATERMHPDERAGALAIQIQVADMKLFARAMQLCFVAAVDSPSQTELRVVCNLECVVVIL